MNFRRACKGDMGHEAFIFNFSAGRVLLNNRAAIELALSLWLSESDMFGSSAVVLFLYFYEKKAKKKSFGSEGKSIDD